MINYFIGQTQASLVTALRAAQDDLAAGASVMQAGAGDATVQQRIEYDTKNRIELILAALNLLDPVNYPALSTRRVGRTRIRVYPYSDNLLESLE